MTTKKKIRPNRTTTSAAPRYKTNPSSVIHTEESTEQSWIVFALGVFVLLGIGGISAIVYVLLLG